MTDSTNTKQGISLSVTALLLIDVQMAFVQRDKNGEQRSTPEAETNIARLLEYFRGEDAHVAHIHHHSREKSSAFRAELPGAAVQAFARPSPEEAVYVKHVNSAFIGTTLEQDLREQDIENLVLCGATANHCVETTARMAGNLGFNVFYASDGVWAYGATGPDGRSHSAEEVLSMTLSNLHGEFASVMSSDGILALF